MFMKNYYNLFMYLRLLLKLCVLRNLFRQMHSRDNVFCAIHLNEACVEIVVPVSKPLNLRT